VQATLKRFGRIDVLVNSAGYGLIGAIEECSEEEIRRQLEMNLLGLLAVTRAALPTLRAQKRGQIFNVSSVAGFRGDPGGGIYASSRFAVEGLSESLAGELAPLGIKVTIVEPGYFRTDLPHKWIDANGSEGVARLRRDGGRGPRTHEGLRRQAGKRP
jgi:NAD(P)-dependent dehydrogenase (short-subunit alcohol dehydrogenase family)